MPIFDHIMIDLETLALTPDAAILQIGAVAFDPIVGVIDKSNPFSGRPNLDQPGRHIDGATVAWWMSQGEDARQVFDGVEKSEYLELTLAWLMQWASEIGARHIWAQGAAFDLPILKHALAQHSLEPWWRYTNERDTRTLFAVAGATCGTEVKVNRQKGIHHTAPDDAEAQAEAVCAAYALLSRSVSEVAAS